VCVVCAVKFLSLLDIANVLLRSFVSSVVIALRSVVQFLLDVVEEPVWVNNTQPCQLADGSLSASFQKNCPPRGSVMVRTLPYGSDRVRSTG